MPSYTQTERPLSVTTPLGKDTLLLTGLRGHEAVSQLFNFQLSLVAELNAEVRFDRILGKNVTVEMRLRDGGKRYFNGLVKRFSQGDRDKTFAVYRAEVVPKLWLLTKKVRCRIFQHLSIPNILQQVLAGLDVTYEISGTYYERDYCVQYRESDFAFASRLMEEEGIYYFFKHADGSHQMVVTDMPVKHPCVPGPATAVYEEAAGEDREDMRVTAWEKVQELRSGECTLWDQCFELPGNPLEATEKTIDSVLVGKIAHNLKVGGNEQLEIYDYPGGYAQRFDGIDRAGGERPADIQRIFEDRTRTVRIRMEQEEVAGLELQGAGDCGHFTAGHEFTLERHFDGNGKYFLTRIEHDAEQGDYRSDQSDAFSYRNHFTCIPSVLRYRPARVTPKPAIDGVQTATVVGPPGEEIFVDKYGRVKVQFPWDREGKKNVDSSCWLRVAQVWAGNRWGAFFWPRIGHEVVVSFEDGDPDRPIVVGSVYNAANMPPLVLPITEMFCGIKSASKRGKAGENYNSVVFVDVKGQEHLAIHSERHMILNAEFDVASRAGRHHGERVAGTHMVTVGSAPGGGSGGGPTYKTPAGATVSGSSWAQPTPQAALGLSSSMVYGTAFAGSFPVSFQVAAGGLFKVIVDPIGFTKAFTGSPIPATADAIFAGGAFGNVQLTLGTSANIVMGQAYDIHVGPTPRDAHGKPTGPMKSYTGDIVGAWCVGRTLGEVIEIAALLFLIAYGAVDSDDWRAVLVMAMQLLTQTCLAALIALARADHMINGTIWKVIGKAFGTGVPGNPAGWNALLGAAELAILVAPILPPVLDSIGEAELHAKTAS